MSLPIDSKISLRHNVNLSQYCTMQVGGPAKYFAEPGNEEELIELIEFARNEGIPFFILGKGSNVIFQDEGYPGLVITLMRFESNRLIADSKNCFLDASSGVHLYRLAVFAKESGLGGAEFLCNVPGTLGGALIMNAGFSRHPGQSNEIGDIAWEVRVLDGDGRKYVLGRKDLKFSYRHSNLGGKVILGAKLKLWNRHREDIDREIRLNFQYRNDKQDLRHPSSGSIFKNPGTPHPAAAKLIETAGLKGKQIGGAMVSTKHANYIINTGRAKSSDIQQLIDEVQTAVFRTTGVELQREVRIIEKP